ncbi:DNA polymerase IV [Paraflavisolibacter sp. H34]|uniref:DNA polymerase IV n=1 Tax=Huijunlia imazamoxiresistens TaxID=3127457 RepID=UPI0030159E2A
MPLPAPARRIAHFDLDAFFVSVECLRDPSLKGKPLIVGGDPVRGVVAACSYEARKYGIHSAMAARKAIQLCPHALFLKGNHALYSQYSRQVTDLIAAKVPLFEKASIDEFYIDLTGMDRYFGVARYTRELRETILKETGLTISYGLSSSKLVSKMATNEAKPNGYLEIGPGRETAFLWPLPVERIPMVGKQTEQKLKEAGLHTIRQLAQAPVERLEQLLGSWGSSLHRKAHGIDEAPVEGYSEQKSVSRESTFAEDSSDPAFLQGELVRLTEKTARDLREEKKLAGCITVKIRYANFETATRQETVDYTALDHTLLAKVKDIFGKLYKKDEKVRLLGVRFSQLTPVTLQMNLFEDPHEKMQLYQTIDGLKTRYGNTAVTKASTLKKKI